MTTKQSEAQAASGAVKVALKVEVQISGAFYAAGTQIELDQASADFLIGSGYAQAVKED